MINYVIFRLVNFYDCKADCNRCIRCNTETATDVPVNDVMSQQVELVVSSRTLIKKPLCNDQEATTRYFILKIFCTCMTHICIRTN